MADGRDHWYLRPGIWFWVVIALGAALRFYCVIFTEGTQDVEIWERHARDVREQGLIGYYHGLAPSKSNKRNALPASSRAKGARKKIRNATPLSSDVRNRTDSASLINGG